MVDAKIDQNPMEPRGEARPSVEAMGELKKAHERLLRNVARFGVIAENRRGDAPCALLMPIEQQLERGSIVRGDPCAQLLI